MFTFDVAATLPDGGTEWGPVAALGIEETNRIAAELSPHDARASDSG